MKNNSVAFMIYGQPGSLRNALTEEKYRKLADHFIENDFIVDSICYHDSLAPKFETELLKYNAILVWVNPIEQGGNREKLDALLINLSEKGCFVSAHPHTILKMGTKDVLYKTRDTEFGGDIQLYQSFEDFKKRFTKSFSIPRILKQYRGNGGDGVFKIERKAEQVFATHAKGGDTETFSSVDEFSSKFKSYFSSGSMLIDQPWNPNIINGMVRCYLCGTTVAGFGYQEINALYPFKKPSQRFYFSEDCGLFQDLRRIMENKWISDLKNLTGVPTGMLPVIWDADFFINKINTEETSQKYSLCEINVSCVSPFPESAIPYIVKEVKKRMEKK